MYSTTCLIVSKRKELSVKHRKIIENMGHNVIITHALDKMFEEIKFVEPEVIFLSDTICENFTELIKQIKILTYNYSPVIIAISKSSNLEDKLEILEHGADECFGEETTSQEFKARLNAHIRRYIENSINHSTGLIGEKLGLKNLRRIIKKQPYSSVIKIEIENFSPYKEIYGEIAHGKVMQTIGALVNSTFSTEDFISHLQNDSFVLITNPMKAEKIASFLTFAFDNMIDKFYSKQDFENKFIKYFSDGMPECKIPLMKLNIGIVNLESSSAKSEKEILATLNELVKICAMSKNSTYIIDRTKLRGETAKSKLKNKILIYEPDDALSYLIQAGCELKSLEGKTIQNLNEISEILKNFDPNIVIFDFEDKGKKQKFAEIVQKIKTHNSEIKIIFTSAERKKTEVFTSGADLYLPKPYEIKTLFNWVDKFLK